MGAELACDLLRDRKQVKHNVSGSSGTDVLANVMHMCKDTYGSDDVFIQSVEAAPEPMCVLATKQQLVDTERFCTCEPSSVLSIDTTFNLGFFCVTLVTLHNLLVTTALRKNLLGLILIH